MAGNKALPLLLGAGALALVASRGKGKPSKAGRVRHGIFVSNDCKTVEIRNQERFENFINGAYRELRTADPDLDWFQLTDALFGDIAPDCSGYPEEPESFDVVQLYGLILRLVGLKMVDDRLANLIDIILDERVADFGQWLQTYSVMNPEKLPENIPSDQVGFSPDFSKIYIGPKWKKNTLIPFMQRAKEEGRLDQAVDHFIRAHNVAVGENNFMRIVRLPQDQPNVQELYAAIKEGYDQVAKG